jgi:hypothetical protein
MSSNALKYEKNIVLVGLSFIVLFFAVLECCSESNSKQVISKVTCSLCEDIFNYQKELRGLYYAKSDLDYFPQLKIRTGIYNDSLLQIKIKWALNIDVKTLNTSELRQETAELLSEILNAIKSKNEFETLLKILPPVVTMEELESLRSFHVMEQQGKNVNISLDTNRLNLFYQYEYFISYAKGTKEYDRFIQNARSEPFLDLLVDLQVLNSAGADTLMILKSLIGKILQADERVRLLAFGYYGLPVAREIHRYIKGKLNKLRRKEKIVSAQDSAYIDFYYSVPFKEFSALYKKYAQIIDGMHIAVRYFPSAKPETFFEASKIKEYLQNVSKVTAPAGKK